MTHVTTDLTGKRALWGAGGSEARLGQPPARVAHFSSRLRLSSEASTHPPWQLGAAFQVLPPEQAQPRASHMLSSRAVTGPR